MDRKRWETAWRALALLGLSISFSFSATVFAADFSEVVELPAGLPLPRYFPHEDGEPSVVTVPPPPRRRLAGCAPWRVPIPTDALDDPSYVGSPYGLGKPSYYGFKPGFGYDDPFGRPLRYCR